MTGLAPTTPRPTRRLFIACELGDDTRAYLARHVPSVAGAPDARPVPPGNLHLTLVFLGNTPVAMVPAICRTVAEACRTRPPIHARMLSIAGTPGRATTRIAAAVFEDPLDAFAQMAAAVRVALVPICDLTPVPMSFWPHVTLVRMRRPRALTAISAESEQMFAFDRVTLYASQSAPGGPAHYVPLARIVLTPNDRPH